MMYHFIFILNFFAFAAALRNTLKTNLHNKHSHLISINIYNPVIIQQCILDSLMNQQISNIVVVSKNTYRSKLIFEKLTHSHEKHHLQNIKYSNNLFIHNIVKPTSLLFIDNHQDFNIVNISIFNQQYFNYKKIIIIDKRSPYELYFLHKNIRRPHPPPK